MYIVVLFDVPQTVRVWSAVSGNQLCSVAMGSSTSVISLSYSQGHFVCSYGPTIVLYQLDTASDSYHAEMIRTFEEHNGRYDIDLCTRHILAFIIMRSGFISFSLKIAVILLSVCHMYMCSTDVCLQLNIRSLQ